MPRNLISQVRDLQRRRARKRRRLAVAEGVRLVEEALAAGVAFRGALADPTLRQSPRGAALLQDLADHAVAVEEIPAQELGRLADTDTPQGILAVIDPPRWQLADIHPQPRHPVLVLDGIQDPGNVGALLRTAFALGSPGAILLKGTADLANPKVMRGGMGATFRLPTATAQDGELAKWTCQQEVTVWAAAVAGTALQRLAPPTRLALVMGNEGAGIRPFVRSLAHQQVAIPLARGAESLNVAVAAGIMLYEVTRAH
ncbi:MAG: RNA methyltransferase [Gemmatimonadales bacterium]|nr:RNA methyltransferase [Gemmatimonadales bacterium]NIN50102.1 RNA methyltransferase [Gemmatimonadales bacterium]NIP07566.1 RNA methyltransferase [Gemmatimonadales bacterium]NIR01722.1 RNA methyltransferase [Gemmatimonadales bacterium]NIS65625.1 RNA methyltransferase [Gemmatimonadales bacterium]